MTHVNQITTADDLIRMPDEGLRYELVQGELRHMSPAGFQHGGRVYFPVKQVPDRSAAEKYP